MPGQISSFRRAMLRTSIDQSQIAKSGQAEPGMRARHRAALDPQQNPGPSLRLLMVVPDSDGSGSSQARIDRAKMQGV